MRKHQRTSESAFMEMNIDRRKLSPGLSVYIDFLRVCAALLVMISHYPITYKLAGILKSTNFAYDAVIVFFVLSGYVISYSADVLDKTFKTFFVNRVARILPVALAAIVVSASIFFLLTEKEGGFTFGHYFYIFFRSITFTNEVWGSHVLSFSNGPYWSLVFEVWCYAIYAMFFYFRGQVRVVMIVSLILFLGPKQAVILPIWLAGSLAYHLRFYFYFSNRILLALTILPVIIYFLIQVPMPRDWSYPYIGAPLERIAGFGLEGAANSGWGYILALLFSVHLYAVGKLLEKKSIDLKRIEVRIIRYLSTFTFTLYLFHYPIMQFFIAVFDLEVHDASVAHILPVYLLTIGAVFVIGVLVEHRKKISRKWVGNAFNFVECLTANCIRRLR